MDISHLPEALYLQGELEAEMDAVRIADEPFEGIPCDRCSELYGRISTQCFGCVAMNTKAAHA